MGTACCGALAPAVRILNMGRCLTTMLQSIVSQLPSELLSLEVRFSPQPRSYCHARVGRAPCRSIREAWHVREKSFRTTASERCVAI